MTKLNKYLCILILGILFSSFTASSNAPTFSGILELVSVFESPTFSFKIESNMTEEIVNTTFNSEHNDFQLSTIKPIHFIQVFDQNENLEYQIPVETTELHLNVNDFKSGVNKIALQFEHTDEMTFASLEKK